MSWLAARATIRALAGGISQIERDAGMWLWLGLLATMGIFIVWPDIDLHVSARFYDPHLGFFEAKTPWVHALYLCTPALGRSLFVLLAVHAWSAKRLRRLALERGWQALGQLCTPAATRLSCLFVCAALLGPGVLIEGVLKNTVGRPRPVQTADFGGDHPFVAALRLGDDPGSHKSFVSSHAATGFALMGLGLGCARPWRRRWFALSLAVGGLVGLGRVLQGGHFLSDIAFAFWSVWLSCRVVLWVDAALAQSRKLGRTGHT